MSTTPEIRQLAQRVAAEARALSDERKLLAGARREGAMTRPPQAAAELRRGACGWTIRSEPGTYAQEVRTWSNKDPLGKAMVYLDWRRRWLRSGRTRALYAGGRRRLAAARVAP